MKPQARRRPLAPVPTDARQYPVPMRDGVLIATDVYLPPETGPFDVLLSRLPYDKDGDEFFMPSVARYWRSLGYAVVVQDVRGKGRSGGEFDPEALDIADAYDTIEWVIDQPWCRGKVAMIGDSFAGYTQWAAAASLHPALVAITPRSASHDRTDQRYDGGVLSLEVSLYWAAETAIDEYLYDYPEPFDWSVRPIRAIVAQELGALRPNWIEAWATADDVRPTPTPPRANKGLPALHLIGLYDHSVAAQFRAWELADRVLDHQYLILDGVDHSWRGLRSSAIGVGVLEADSQFLDRYFEHLREFISAGFTASFTGSYAHRKVRWRPALDVPWREADTWPPLDAASYTLWAARSGDSDGGDGALVATEPGPQAPLTWTHDPEHPVPSRGHAFHELSERPDLADLRERPDVLEFNGPPQEERLELAGIATFHAHIRSTAQRTTLVVTLVDQLPDGRTWEVRTGRLRIDDATRSQEVTVNLGPVAYVFPLGHRLGVRISSSLFPRLALDSGNLTNTWVDWAPSRSEQAIQLGGGGGARLRCHTLAGRVEGL